MLQNNTDMGTGAELPHFGKRSYWGRGLLRDQISPSLGYSVLLTLFRPSLKWSDPCVQHSHLGISSLKYLTMLGIIEMHFPAI